MRAWIIPAAALFAFGIGCSKSSPEGGAPGTPNSFKIKVPATAKDIKQGTAETVELSIDRGSEFKKDVKLSVSKVDKLDIKLSKDTIKASEDTKFSIVVTVDGEAALAEHVIKVTGTPDGGGAPTSEDFKVKVTPK